MNGGELFDRILHLNYDPTELDVVVYMKQICEGVAHLHKNQILHLDLKVSQENYNSKWPHVNSSFSNRPLKELQFYIYINYMQFSLFMKVLKFNPRDHWIWFMTFFDPDHEFDLQFRHLMEHFKFDPEDPSIRLIGPRKNLFRISIMIF